MNIPEIYLIEPYNAYTVQKGGRKKHWHEIVEEQALLQKIIADQQAQQALQEAQSKTLPPHSPSIAQQTVGNMAGGAGGNPVWDYWNPSGDVIDFTGTPLTGDAPLTVVFNNLTTSPELDIYLWLFGDGTTSTDVNPTHVYQTGSNFTASLQVSGSTGPGGITTKNGYISASIPTVTSTFTYVTSSGPGPITASFTNTSTNSSQTPTTTYLWNFGDSTSSILSSPAAHPYANTGSFTASLQATGSYGIASNYTRSFFVPAPTLTAAFTFTTSSNAAPSTASFTNTTAYNGSGTLTYLWLYGSGSLTSSAQTPNPLIYTVAGPYTASLQVTESSYNIKSSVTHSWRLV